MAMIMQASSAPVERIQRSPASIYTEGVPRELDNCVVEKMRRYRNCRSAWLKGWIGQGILAVHSVAFVRVDHLIAFLCGRFRTYSAYSSILACFLVRVVLLNKEFSFQRDSLILYKFTMWRRRWGEFLNYYTTSNYVTTLQFANVPHN